jgi:uncharacterized membrane protein
LIALLIQLCMNLCEWCFSMFLCLCLCVRVAASVFVFLVFFSLAIVHVRHVVRPRGVILRMRASLALDLVIVFFAWQFVARVMQS